VADYFDAGVPSTGLTARADPVAGAEAVSPTPSQLAGCVSPLGGAEVWHSCLFGLSPLYDARRPHGVGCQGRLVPRSSPAPRYRD
jgi:hypothetical protein